MSTWTGLPREPRNQSGNPKTLPVGSQGVPVPAAVQEGPPQCEKTGFPQPRGTSSVPERERTSSATAGVGAVPGKARPGGQEAVGPFQAFPIRLLAFHGIRPGNGGVVLESDDDSFESRSLAAAGDHPPRVFPRPVAGHRKARKILGEEERGKRGRRPPPSQRALWDACSRAFSREQGRRPAPLPSEPADRSNGPVEEGVDEKETDNTPKMGSGGHAVETAVPKADNRFIF